jgi:hypothetical protein
MDITNIPKKLIKTYSSMYFPKKKEQFNSDSDFLYNSMMTLIAWIILGFAVYLSFRCNKGQPFNLGGLLLAIFFSPFYVIYHLAVTNLCGLMK